MTVLIASVKKKEKRYGFGNSKIGNLVRKGGLTRVSKKNTCSAELETRNSFWKLG
jgi:hypothetical protein